MKIINLPKRLQAIADLIHDNPAVADIGTDHGLLPVYLAQTGIARRIIGIDSSRGSLGAALRNAEKYNVSGKIELIHAQGLECITPDDADVIVIAGVGGETIAGILGEASWIRRAYTEGKLKLILQPQTKLDVLKNFMHDKGYRLKQEITVTDRGRAYTILEV